MMITLKFDGVTVEMTGEVFAIDNGMSIILTPDDSQVCVPTECIQ